MNSNFSRRNFLRNAALTTGLAAAGTSGLAMGETLSTPAAEQKLPREVWIAALSQAGLTATSSEQMIDRLLQIMEEKKAYRPDIICLPETVQTANVSKSFTTQEKVVAGEKAIERFSAFAKQNNCYIICPVHTTEKGKFYNAAVLIDRSGKRMGEYRKIHPTEGEMSGGLTPGPLTPPVFETDFGKIGVQICFDILWDGGWSSLEEQGAEIVFWPSAYGGGQAINNKVMSHRYIIVSSTHKGASKICDITGLEPASTGFWDKNYLCAPVNLEKVFMHSWPYTQRFDEIKEKYGRKIRITIFHEEEWAIIESLSSDVSVGNIMKEYDFKTFTQHKKSAEVVQIKMRNK